MTPEVNDFDDPTTAGRPTTNAGLRLVELIERHNAESKLDYPLLYISPEFLADQVWLAEQQAAAKVRAELAAKVEDAHIVPAGHGFTSSPDPYEAFLHGVERARAAGLDLLRGGE